MASHPVSRRHFVITVAAAGGGLLLGCRIGDRRELVGDRASAPFAPNAFVRVGPDGRVVTIIQQVEMGQGTYTTLSMLIAEELDVGMDQVSVEQAPPNVKLYMNPLLGDQITGASSSMRALYQPLRHAGAAARSMLVAAAAQQWQVDAASCTVDRGVVKHPGTGRTLPYGALTDAAARLQVPTQVTVKDPKSFTLIGTPAKRLDSPAKVNGTAQYSIDVRVPGMKVATVAASPVLGGKVAALDDRKALAVKGVRQVVALGDVVAVVADDMWAATQGLKGLAVLWNEGPNAAVSTADVVRGLEAASRVPGVLVRKDGDTDAALARADRRMDAIYEAPFLAHVAMEPLSCTVHVRADGCEVWTGSQVLARAQATAAAVTGFPLERVVVHSQLLGGGFGRRLEFDYVTQAVRIAQRVDGPVKVVWTREEDVRHDVFRPYYFDRIHAGLDAHGQPIAWTHRIVGPSIVARWLPAGMKNGVDGDAVDGAAQLAYDIPAIRIEYVRHEEPVVNTGFWRGVGVTHNNFVIESFIDELAAAAKQDPVRYRRALLGKSPRAVRVLDVATAAAGWGTPLPAGHGRGVSFLFSGWGTYLAQVAEVEVSKAGDVLVHRVVCAVDCGIVVNPDVVKAQIEGGIIFGIGGALFGEITLANGRVEQSNFHDVRVLRMNEAPVIEVHLVKSDEAPGGIGEPGTAAIAPAIGNAICAVTGRRIRKLPFKPEVVRG
jgi:isoquinoline 1-oxidoreductase beta subunit